MEPLSAAVGNEYKGSISASLRPGTQLLQSNVAAVANSRQLCARSSSDTPLQRRERYHSSEYNTRFHLFICLEAFERIPSGATYAYQKAASP